MRELRFCPNSREEPEALLEFLLRLGEQIPNPAVIFPTRDDDIVFLQRFRDQLSQRFVLLLPESSALQGCLDKWETYEWAQAAGVPSPRSWNIDSEEDLRRITSEVSFPCVLKPTSAHLWRKAGNWEKVGRRKAIAISSQEELFSVYHDIARSESRALLQELISGGDDCLYVAACYLDRQCNFIGGFTAQKLLQVPEGLGTGCIVQAIDRPDLLVMARKLLQKMRFTGIAEVEFKWDHSCREYKLIEVNPRAVGSASIRESMWRRFDLHGVLRSHGPPGSTAKPTADRAQMDRGRCLCVCFSPVAFEAERQLAFVASAGARTANLCGLVGQGPTSLSRPVSNTAWSRTGHDLPATCRVLHSSLQGRQDLESERSVL